MLKRNKKTPLLILIFLFVFSSISADEIISNEDKYAEFIIAESKANNVPYELSFAIFEVVSGFDNTKQLKTLCGIAQLSQYIHYKNNIECEDSKESIKLGIKRLSFLHKTLSINDTIIAYRYGIMKRKPLPTFVINYAEKVKYFLTVYRMKY